MIVTVCDNEEFNLSSSVLHEELDPDALGEFDLSGIEKAKGAVVFDSEMKVLPRISAWLTYGVRNNKIAPDSARTYGRNIRYFIDYLQGQSLFKHCRLDEALYEIEEHDILEYMTYMKDELGLESATIRNRDACIRAFFEDYLCQPRGNKPALRSDNPYELGMISPSVRERKIEMCTVDELLGLIKSADTERERCLLQFTYDSGVRRKEICIVKKQHVTDALNFERKSLILDDHTIQIPSMYKPLYVAGVKGRNRQIKERQTLVSAASLSRVKRYHASPLYRAKSRKFGSDAPAFLNAHGNPYTPSSISKLFHKLSKRALKLGYIKRPIHPHMMRHGFAGSVLRSPDLGGDAVERLLTVKECLGHSRLKTTERYTSLPYDIYGQLMDDDGVVLTRADIMSRVYSRTKKQIKFGDEK